LKIYGKAMARSSLVLTAVLLDFRHAFARGDRRSQNKQTGNRQHAELFYFCIRNLI
jgi:hypothetical protein